MKNLMNGFPTESITLKKDDGTTIGNIEALVSGGKIFIDDPNVPIEEGDLFKRTLSNGLIEEYTVIDRGFYRGMKGIPDHYQVSVEKKSKIKKSDDRTITYNINNNGDSGKVNINSTDNSVNISLNKDEKQLFEALKLSSKGLDNESEVIGHIEKMELSVGQESFKESYNSFIQSVANHITIFAPFIPMITPFLTK